MDRFTINEQLILSLWDRFDCSDAAELNVQADGAGFTIRRYNAAAAAGAVQTAVSDPAGAAYANAAASSQTAGSIPTAASIQSAGATQPVSSGQGTGSTRTADSGSAGSTRSAAAAVSNQPAGAGDAKQETLAQLPDTGDTKPGNSSNSTYVRSPLPGTFYRAASPADEPFVILGREIHKGDVIGIVESMKMMNEITSETDGIVAEILAGDGSMVGYDEKLIRLENINV